MKKKNKIKINVLSTEEFNLTEYKIEFKSKSKKVLEKVEKIETLNKFVIKYNDQKIMDKKIKKHTFKKKKFKKKKFFKKKD